MRKSIVSKIIRHPAQALACLLLIINSYGQHKEPPVFTIACPTQSIAPGETVEFKVSTKDKYWAEKLSTLNFNWTVSNGTINAGQGTPTIKLVIPTDMTGTTLTAAVEVSSSQPISYQTVGDSCAVSIIQIPKARLITEAGHKWLDDMHTDYNLAEFESALKNDPSSSGVIIYYGNKRAKREALGALREIRKWSSPRFSNDRLTIINGGERDKTLFQFYYVPAGATFPSPAQEPIDKRKVAELGANVNCEQLFATLDSFFVSLQDDPNSTGHIAVYGETGKTVKNFVRELQIKKHRAMRNIDSSRINITRGEMRAAGETTTELFIVPAGEEKPQIIAEEWSYKLPGTTKRFLLGGGYLDGIAGCDGYDMKLYAEFLRANPKLIGSVVIKETSAAKFRERQTEVLNEMVKNNRIARGRIKIVFVKVKPNMLQEAEELWLAPLGR